MNIYKDIRTASAMTGAEFAEAMDVSARTVSSWERGEKKPHFKNLMKALELAPVAFEARRQLVTLLRARSYGYREAWAAVMAVDVGAFTSLDRALLECLLSQPSERMKRSKKVTSEMLKSVKT